MLDRHQVTCAARGGLGMLPWDQWSDPPTHSQSPARRQLSIFLRITRFLSHLVAHMEIRTCHRRGMGSLQIVTKKEVEQILQVQ